MKLIWQSMLFAAALSAAAAPVSLESIAGTRQHLPEGRIALAFGAPESLFTDGTCVAVQSGEIVPGKDAGLLASLPTLQGEASFTVALFNAGATGRVQLELRNANQEIGRVEAELSAGEWSRLSLSPGSGDDRKLTLTGDGNVKITRWTLYRSLEQIYSIGTEYPVEHVYFQNYGDGGALSAGLTPGSHRNDRGWNTPAAGERDGVPAAIITENYQPLLSLAREAKSGIPLPVDTRNGAVLIYRVHNNPVITLYKEKEGHRNCNIGKKDAWSEGMVPLNAAELDADGNGSWNGRLAVSWNHSNTLAQSYGKGDFAFLAIQSANRIELPAGATRIAFQYDGKNGTSVAFTNPIPAGASAVAMVNIGPGATQLVWKLADGWTGGRVIRDSARSNSLVIKSDTFVLE